MLQNRFVCLNLYHQNRPPDIDRKRNYEAANLPEGNGREPVTESFEMSETGRNREQCFRFPWIPANHNVEPTLTFEPILI